MYKHNFQFLWYTVLYTLMPNTKLTSNVRESNLSPKTIPSIYLIKWGFFSKTRHLTFRLIYFYFHCRYYIFSLDFCMYAYLLFWFGLYATLSIQCQRWLPRHVWRARKSFGYCVLAQKNGCCFSFCLRWCVYYTFSYPQKNIMKIDH